jgi:hypothetical protein
VPAVTYDVASKTATFHPAAALTGGVTYTATIKGTGANAATDLAGHPLSGNPALPFVANDYVWTFTTGLTPDTTRPLVLSTVPVTTIPGPTAGVATNTAITVAFNENMNPATITAVGAITLTGPGATPVIGAVPAVTFDAASNTATFHPASALTGGVTYTATVKGTGVTAVTDAAGNALAGIPAAPTVANDYVWTFTTSLAPDTTRPLVTATVPVTTTPGPTLAVPTNTAITVAFNENMLPASITTAGAITVTGPGATPVVGAVPAVTYDVASKTATFHPAAALAGGVTYTATVKGTGFTAVTDSAGNALAGNPALPLAANDYVWTFTTNVAPDTTRPLVTVTVPVTTSPGPTLGVPTNTAITATFNENMNPATLTSSGTFTLTGPGVTPVTGAVPAVTYDVVTKTATFLPAAALTGGVTYTATIKGTGVNAATDSAGNALAGNPALPLVANDYVWTFTTAPDPIPLGLLATYGMFGGTAGMTNTGIQTIVNADIGTTATGAVNITGFHDATDTYTVTGANNGLVSGTINSCAPSDTNPVNATKCAAATQARLDAQTAFNLLALMPSSGVLAGNLASTTIYPGVYTNASSVKIEGGNLTLDALGDPNAVFVFQIGSTLTVGGPGAAFPQSIILVGSAKAKNVYWQVGTSATINAAGGGTMEGTIIANSGVTFSTVGNTTIARLNGRAASLISSVTLVDTVINLPTP